MGRAGLLGTGLQQSRSIKYFLPEWMEALERDFNHPAIIGWCPFNETWDYEGRRQDDSLLANVYKMTKLYDTTRPCIDTSGNYHVVRTSMTYTIMSRIRQSLQQPTSPLTGR